MSNDTTTTDLADFGTRELNELRNILDAYLSEGAPVGFDNDEVTPMFNRDSGCVFLTNSSYQAAMMNGDTLEVWHYTPYEGLEGFAEELAAMVSEMHPDDVEYCAEMGITS